MQDVLTNLALSNEEFEQVVKLIWNLPNVRSMDMIAKRLIATVLVGIQPNKTDSEK